MNTTRLITACALMTVLMSAAAVEPATAQEKQRRPKVGLVLSGGGAKGLAHIGVLKVLEEAGVQVDIITGTSMGSLVGGLYAIGYDAGALERFALEEQLSDLISDEISLTNIPIDEKIEEGKYVLSFTLKGLSVELPKGLIKGQKLMTRLSSLTLLFHQYENFNKLPIPFRCTATDIETGEVVVLDKGFLPKALRASMSIPSVFTPVEIGGRLLVDGAVVNNFPVTEAKKMGADIIIGVDVGAPLYKKEQIDSLADILEQSISFLNEKTAKEQRNNCNILILPSISDIGSGDFGMAAEIIKRGEDAARTVFPLLKNLAAKMNNYPKTEKVSLPLPAPGQKIRIDEIRIEGLKKVSRGLVMDRLGLHVPSTVTLDELEESINDLYGSRYFEGVIYRLIPNEEGNVLLLIVEEKSTYQVRFGLSYDSYMSAAIYMNLTLHNLIGLGSLLSVTGRLSENPGFEAKYYIHTGWRPGIGIGLNFHYDQYRVLTYSYADRFDGVKSSYDLRIFSGRLVVQAIFSASFVLGLGIHKEYNLLTPDVNSPYLDDNDTESLHYIAYLKFDIMDRYYYPRSGLRLDCEGAIITDHLAMGYRNNFNEFYRLTAGMFVMIPFHRRISVMLYARIGAMLGTQIPNGYLFYLGGLYTFNTNFYPFPGVRIMELSGTNAAVYQGGIQLEPWDNIIIIPRVSAGSVAEKFKQLYDNKNFYLAYGATLGYNSIIGPLETTVMYGGIRKEVMVYVNIGFRY